MLLCRRACQRRFCCIRITSVKTICTIFTGRAHRQHVDTHEWQEFGWSLGTVSIYRTNQDFLIFFFFKWNIFQQKNAIWMKPKRLVGTCWVSLPLSDKSRADFPGDPPSCPALPPASLGASVAAATFPRSRAWGCDAAETPGAGQHWALREGPSTKESK